MEFSDRFIQGDDSLEGYNSRFFFSRFPVAYELPRPVILIVSNVSNPILTGCDILSRIDRDVGPQLRLIKSAVEMLNKGSVIV